jgi:cob(I)alamin adenosyltransferase
VRIYTKTGDDGTTGLAGGKRLKKSDARVDAYGSVDELNAALGFARSLIGDEEIAQIVGRLQRELFVLGSDLAAPPAPNTPAPVSTMPRITAAMVERLEREIDRFADEVGPLTSFILPGGSKDAAAMHIARCVCRRAERTIATLASRDDIGEFILPYINRLSDHLFELARLINYRLGVPEHAWSRHTADETGY